MPGPVLFARYAYPPNALGYCGPDDPAGLLRMGADGRAVDELARLASRFDGAWPYLELIAGCNGIADPLDRRVVEAYWVGNELLDRVPAATLMSWLSEHFWRPAGPMVSPAMTAVPHHSLHVFAVYPWLGLLRAGAEVPALRVLDRCRIRWGRVAAVRGDMVAVRERPLCFAGSRLGLGPARLGWARGSADGVGFAGPLSPGDMVSLHWDWVCDRLTPGALRWLVACTARNLRAVNGSPRPGPAGGSVS